MSLEKLIGTLGRYKRTGFFYMMHLENLESVLAHGIYCHKTALEKGMIMKDISSAGVQRLRSRQKDVTCQSAEYSVYPHMYVPLYFATNTPMQFVVVDRFKENVVLLKVDANVCRKPGTLFSNGNVADHESSIYDSDRFVTEVDWDRVFDSKRPAFSADWKRVRAAEVLIYEVVEPNYIREIHVHCNASESCRKKVSSVVDRQNRPDIDIDDDLRPDGIY